MLAGMEVEVELELPIAHPGFQLNVPVQAELAGELTMEDVLAPRSVGTPTGNPLMRIAERHRALARGIAGGLTTSEAAAVFNYSAGTVSNLMQDPAFKNLIQFYRRAEDEVFRSTQERLADVTNSALDLIEEKLEDPEERKKIPITQALAIATAGADRTGNGPQSSTVAVNVNVDLANRMKRAREQAMDAMRDVTPQQAAE